MPELPEVETTVQELKRLIEGKRIKGFWTDWPKYVSKGSLGKKIPSFERCIKGRRIERVERRGKNIVIFLSSGGALLIHQKISGHLLYGKWKKLTTSQVVNWEGDEEWQGQKWVPDAPKSSYLWDPKNRFIRLIFFLDNGKHLALSDLRRFAKVICGSVEEVESLPEIKELGPDPTDKSFTLSKFKDLFKGKRGIIKTLLMDQRFIAGIGNIYLDEILYEAGIHPQKKVESLKDGDLKKIYEAIKKILKKAIALGGTSIDDYRKPKGERGRYTEVRHVYRREGESCYRCGSKVKRIKIGGRSAYFCPNCQKK